MDHKMYVGATEEQIQFLDVHKRQDIDQIAKNFGVTIKAFSHDDKQGYQIKGKNSKDAKKQLRKVVGSVQSDTMKLQKPCCHAYFTSERGRKDLNLIELQNKCTISLQNMNRRQSRKSYQRYSKHGGSKAAPKSRQSSNSDQDAMYTVNGVNFHVIKGDITKLKVDVLINTAHKSMDHKYGLAKAVVKHGGQSIQDECHQYVQDNGEVDVGNVITTGTGTLQCNLLLHAVAPIWQGGGREELRTLDKLVRKCVAKVPNNGFNTSIAFPAMGSGTFKFPIVNATSTIVDCLAGLAEKSAPVLGSIKDIYLCDVNEEAVDAFKSCLTKHCDQTSEDSDDDTESEKESRSESSDSACEECSGSSGSEYESHETPPRKNVIQHRQSAASSVHGNVIQVVKGELADMKVDVLVNSVKSDLDFSAGALSKSIVNKGGDDIENHLKSKFPSGIKPGQVVVSKGGNLACKWIYHGTLLSWNHDGSEAEKKLEEFVINCLTMANKHKMTSIAIPSMGTGRLKFPADVVARGLFDSCESFLTKFPDTSLKNILLVVYSSDKASFKAFTAEENSRSGSSNQSSGALAKKPNVDSPKITVLQGDITQETSDVIVNSTNEKIDLSKGAISSAILNAAGPQLQDECTKQEQVMKNEGFVSTSSGNLKCSAIFHIKTQRDVKGWTNMVVKCLEEAEQQGHKTISFPALGTGRQKCSPHDVSHAMHKGIQAFSSAGRRNLQEVRIVVFDKRMIDVFDPTKQTMQQSAASGSTDNNDNVVIFEILSDDVTSFPATKKMIGKVCEDKFKTETITDDNITKLRNKQHRHLTETVGSKYVHLTMDSTKGEIVIAGWDTEFLDAKYKTKEYISNIGRQKDEFEKAQLVADFFQWKYESSPGKMTNFYLSVNFQLEMAYKSKKPNVEIQDRHGEKYCVDFKQMKEWPVKTPTTMFNVTREEKRQTADSQVPQTWTQMPKDKLMVEVSLAPGSTEFERVKTEFLKSSGTGITVVQIDRVQNTALFQQYAAKRTEILTKNQKYPQRWLWHGTDFDTVPKINQNGFNRSYCGKHATRYGNGVYFAVNANYSIVNGFCKSDSNNNCHIYSAQVLVGDACSGRSGMSVLPTKGGNNSVLTYDSASDDPGNPSMFIIFHDSQAYPSYHITFR